LTDTTQTGESHETAYGTSAPIQKMALEEMTLLVCSPTTADPRATIQALKDQGTTHLWLCESVGSLSPLLEAGDWMVCDDYIDGTRGQHYTYYSDKAGGYVQQVPAFDVKSREALIKAVYNPHPQPLSLRARGFKRGVYVCVSNTRMETPAETTFWLRAGGHVVGRYLSPYLTLARELEMAVAVLAHVVREGGQAGQSVALDAYLPVVQQAWSSVTSG
jgi:purine nucleoside phosphorylase